MKNVKRMPRGMLMQDIEILLVRLPILVRRAAAGSVVVNRALALFAHVIYSFCCRK